MITDNKYTIDTYLKDALVQKHDNKPNRMIRQELADGTIVIGKNRYDALKQILTDSLLRSQKEQIKIFEDYHGITDYIKKQSESTKETEEKLALVAKKKEHIINSINKTSVEQVFKMQYKKFNGVDFIETPETIENITPLILYFSKNNEFLNYGVKDENGKFLSTPSLDKGLCIVGGFGNGKTSIMNTFQKMFIGLNGFTFGRFSSHEIVARYEEASKHNHPEILENFWRILTRSELYIDDVKAEPEALAYGKKNILNTLFQERYNKRLKTHISINYASGHNSSPLEALLEFKTKYSNQVYDRIYEMYNVIEFKGKSFRK
jgi:DNA replication protein DnaC